MLQQDAYLESQVLTADPLELVRLLYRAAADATRDARLHLAAGRILERSHQVSKVHAILTQLSVTLDHERGGTLSRNLAHLYDYMQRRLLEANQQQKAEPLVEVEGLLATLLEGWEQTRVVADPAPLAPSPNEEERIPAYGGYPAMFESGGAAEYASQSWSL